MLTVDHGKVAELERRDVEVDPGRLLREPALRDRAPALRDSRARYATKPSSMPTFESTNSTWCNPSSFVTTDSLNTNVLASSQLPALLSRQIRHQIPNVDQRNEEVERNAFEKPPNVMHSRSHQRVDRDQVVVGVGWSRMVAVMVAAALGVVGFLAAGSIARGATRSSATVSLRKTALGMTLIAPNGHTIYLFGRDRNDKSACSASCAQFWPPLLSRSKPTAGPGVHAALLGTTKRSNGSMQVTYNQHPLYTYVLDKQAGQTKGEGVSAFGATWHALSAKGAAIMKTSTTTTTTTTTTPTNPYP